MENRIIIPQYFAGSFSPAGFTNYLTDAIGEMKKIYIIKGTAGSGKSTLMKKIALAAEEAEEAVERIYCSSDVSSLDGVVIPSRSFAIVDGTAPHVMEATYPIAVETIINTGDYINAAIIEKSRDEIISLTQKKKALFHKGELLLRSISPIESLNSELLEECYDSTKGFSFCMNVIRKESKLKQWGKIIKRSCFAFGKDGVCVLNSFAEAEKIYCVSELFSPFILGTIKLLAEEHNLSAVWSPSPLNPTEPCAIYFPTSKRLYISSQFRKDGENISSARFEKRDSLKQNKEKRKFISKTRALILEEAKTYLLGAMECHKALESFYVSALNKDGLDCLCRSVIVSLFGAE
jgi:hypothetical protein